MLLIALLSARVASACTLEDCRLPLALHREEEGVDPSGEDGFDWMNHELALARQALRQRDSAEALRLALELEELIRLRQEELLAARGPRRAVALHRSVVALIERAGGETVPALPDLE